MHDATRELRSYIETQKEEVRLPERMVTVLQDIDTFHAYTQRSLALGDAIRTLEKEELSIDPRTHTQLAALEAGVFQSIATINEHIAWLLAELTPKKWFTLLSLLEKNQTKDHFQILIDSFSESQKEQFYKHIRTIDHTKEERILLHRFEERLTYTYAFLQRVQPTPTDETLRPFEQFFETYVPVYHQKTAATLRWLKHDVFTMPLTDALLERYAQSAIRRLEIGKEIEDPRQKQQHIQLAVAEFQSLLHAQQQKKSSK